MKILTIYRFLHKYSQSAESFMLFRCITNVYNKFPMNFTGPIHLSLTSNVHVSQRHNKGNKYKLSWPEAERGPFIFAYHQTLSSSVNLFTKPNGNNENNISELSGWREKIP